MRLAVYLMYAGAIVEVVRGVLNGLTSNNVTIYTVSPTRPNTGTVQYSHSLATGIIQGIVIGGLWLWMAWKAGAGQGWSRMVSSVFFGLLCLNFIGSTVALARPDGVVSAFIVILIEFGVGLAAIIALWRPESSEFFWLSKQARLAGAYDAAPYPGHQHPGYGHPPQYGYGHKSQYGRPPQYGEPYDGELPPHDDEG